MRQAASNRVRKANEEILEKILNDECIEPAYQPIVSLTDGQIYGFEALSRVSDRSLNVEVEHMFKTADRVNKAWELETLCRAKSLQGAAYMDMSKKLFLNVSPNVIHASQFREGFTKSHLGQFGLLFHNIVFEITERVAVMDKSVFLDSIYHYRNQNYRIAIDDVGAGYSGLNLLSDVKPDLIKLDINLIQSIDKDEVKQLLCKAMVDFAQGAGIKVIAEGIETEEELATLIKMNVDLGQGFFLGIPRRSFADVAPEKREIIKRYATKKYTRTAKGSVFPAIGHISKNGYCFSPEEHTATIHEKLRLNPTITEFAILEDEIAIGLITRTYLNEMLKSRFKSIFHSGKPIRHIIKTDFLRVNDKMPVDQVSRLAMQRRLEQRYDPIVVEREGKYAGIVTVEDLLNTCTKVDIDVAAHSSPLTGLPGNLLIEREIVHRVLEKNPYCIVYTDINGFKAYNDAYGFQNGDKVLALTAEILKKCATRNEFIGHIGGDIFIIICDYHEGEEYCQSVINEFASQVISLYREEDVKNGYIVSKNRNGVTENFPIASLSIAGISNRKKAYQSLEDYSRDIAQLKKKCKQHPGNYFEIY